MTNQVVQDTISLQLSAEKTVTNETVKVTIGINAILSDPNEAMLRADIRQALSALFTKEADWKFANQSRYEDSGYERVSLQAITRVPAIENYDLKNRLDRISKQGLQFQLAAVDDSVPHSKIEETEQELRRIIIEKATAELKATQQATGRQYRLSLINFGRGAEVGGGKGMIANASFAASPPSGGFRDARGDDEALGNSQKLTLNASITLACLVPTYEPIPAPTVTSDAKRDRT